MPESTSYKPDWLSRLLTAAMQGPLPLLLLLTALVGGIVALMITPREEEPQIIVPLADVLVTAPGLSAEQIERQIAAPLKNFSTKSTESNMYTRCPGRNTVW
jgi:multidrug efflux pump subunit AcrB